MNSMLVAWNFLGIFLVCLALNLGSSAMADEPQLRAIEDTTKVSILIASPQGSTRSSFGHAYFRFSNELDAKKDYVVELVANESEDSTNSWGSVFRGIGLSIKENYKTKIVTSDFEKVKYEMTIVKNRSLTTFPLKLSPDQAKKVQKYLIENQDSLEKEDYLFFSNNCASKISAVLDSSLGYEKSSFQSNVPIYLENKYYKIIDWSRSETEISSGELRKQIVKTLFPIALVHHKNPLLSNLPSQLTSPSFYERAYAIIKLLHLKELDPSLDNQTIRQSQAYLLSTSITEEAHNSTDLLKQVRTSGSGIRIVPLLNSNKIYRLYGVTNESEVSIRPDLFLNSEKKLMIRYFYSFVINSESKTISERYIDVPASDFGLSLNNNEIQYKDERGHQFNVGILLESKIFGTKAILSHINFRADIQAGGSWLQLIPVALIHFEGSSNEKLAINRKFSPLDAIAMVNFSASSNLGSCAALVAIQKILFDQTYFAPQYQRLTGSENMALFKQALEGKFIIVPGHSNIREWFASLDEEAVKTIVEKLSYEINIKNFGLLMKQYFTRIPITIENIIDLKHSIAMGMIVPVRFKVDGVREEHTFIVTEIIERDSFFELGVYDSNIGGYLPAGSKNLETSERFKIDKKTSLFLQKDYTQGTQLFVDQQIFEKRNGFVRAKQHPDLEKFAAEAISKRKFAFTPNELSLNGLQ